MKKLLLLLIVVACSKPADEVIVVERTRSFHREDCQKTMMAHTQAMSFGEARSRNFMPCPGCRPDSTMTGGMK